MEPEITPPQLEPTSAPQPIVSPEAFAFWAEFGGGFRPYALNSHDQAIDQPSADHFVAFPRHRLASTIPDGVVAIGSNGPDAETALRGLMQPLLTTRAFAYTQAERTVYLVAIEGPLADFQRAIMPEGVVLKVPGNHIVLPTDSAWLEQMPIRCAADLPRMSGAALCALVGAHPVPTASNITLTKHSLRGQSAEFEARAVKAVPLLGRVVLSGQATAFFAPPNAGKTLITLKLLIDAISEGRLNPENCFYINADDNSEGFAAKLRLLDDAGAHVLAPGHKGFKAKELIDHLKVIGRVKGGAPVLVIIDTLKKFTSLMDKGAVSDFAQACRFATMNGATIVGFGHTNKNTSESGKLRYGGTTDLIDDFDAAYLMTPLPDMTAADERVVRFENIKARGSNARLTAYAYAGEEDIPYAERLASVREVVEAELETFAALEAAPAIDLVPIITACITERDFAKMALGKEVAKRSGASEREALRVIDRHSGTDPAQHLWTFERKARGAQVFRMLARKEAEAA